jgi:cellulose synthase/poly-beta-1,6-N-acetylglucosamine synthase-like glycosyltransferase
MTIHSPVIRSFLEELPESVDIPLLNGLAVQVIPTVEDLARARTHQFAACIASESVLVVWDDDAINMVKRAKSIEWELMQLLWTTDSRGTNGQNTSRINLPITEKEAGDDTSLESAIPKPRPTMFINTILVSISLCVLIGTLGLGLREILIELMVQRGYSTGSPYIRFAFLAFTPIWMFFGMFFFNVLITNIAELIGPINQLNINSKHFSATCVPRLTSNLPHVTIQCPVYKEGLAAVIEPTIRSIKKAISTYELQGGSANIFVNDDGLQIISEDLRNERIQFYADHGIGWVARPKHDSSPGGFVRRGKFKKASNMNFAMDISCKLEEKLKTIERHQDWSSTDEAEATAWALEQTVADGGGIAWADGNIRIGDYILISKSAQRLTYQNSMTDPVIVDSDTQVPEDCLLDAVSEMEQSPEVAILQFSSGVMQVSHNYFENGITFFTNLVYSAINYGVANGDVAPFVGHNAILRWSALQDVASFEDGRNIFWSESHVSEDFDMALRLQIKGYITRLANWAHGGFKEGVSLTVRTSPIYRMISPRPFVDPPFLFLGIRRTCSVAEIRLWL